MNRPATDTSDERTVAQSFQEYGRGVAGGLVLSLPLLYTMEVWWAGHSAHPLRLLAYTVATFVLLLGYNRYAGLRRDASMVEVAIDSIEEMGIGIILAALILWLTGRYTLDMTPHEILGKIMIEAMTVAIGVSVGTAQLGGGDDGDSGVDGESSNSSPGANRDQGAAQSVAAGRGNATGDDAADDEIDVMGQVVIALCGAVLFAANVAPTEEIVMIATEISSWRLLGLALFSLALGALILFFSEFKGARKFVHTGGPLIVIADTLMTYAAALTASALILWFFGRFDGEALITCVGQTVVLGVAGTIGASAGRLLLQR